MPLDGGQVMNTILSSHFSLVSCVFRVTGIACLTILAAYLGDNIFFTITFVFFLFTIIGVRSSFDIDKISKKIRNKIYKEKSLHSKNDIVKEIYLNLKDSSFCQLAVSQKFQIIKQIYSEVKSKSPSLVTSSVLLVGYLSCIVVSPVYSFISAQNMVARAKDKFSSLVVNRRLSRSDKFRK